MRSKKGLSLRSLLTLFYIIVFGVSVFAPNEFIPTAFDSGGVANEPMTSTFMLPFAVGACEAIGGTVMKVRLADVEQFAGISQTEIDGDREIIFILASVKTSAQIKPADDKDETPKKLDFGASLR